MDDATQNDSDPIPLDLRVELPAWRRLPADLAIGATAELTSPPKADDSIGSPPKPLMIAAGLLLSIGALCGIVLVSQPPTTAPNEVPMTPLVATNAPLAFVDNEPAIAADPAPQTTTTQPTTTPETAVPEETAPHQEAVAASSPTRQAVFSGGRIYLRGEVPNQHVSDTIQQRAEAVIGVGNVINEYRINPDVIFDADAGAPLIVEDLVLFESGGTAVAPEFMPLLELGVVLMLQNPNVTITVIGHTDGLGSPEDNLALAKARVDAVADYWAAMGIPRNRISVIAVGEDQPLSDNDSDEGRRINRRVEFVIRGLLGD